MQISARVKGCIKIRMSSVSKFSPSISLYVHPLHPYLSYSFSFFFLVRKKGEEKEYTQVPKCCRCGESVALCCCGSWAQCAGLGRAAAGRLGGSAGAWRRWAVDRSGCRPSSSAVGRSATIPMLATVPINRAEWLLSKVELPDCVAISIWVYVPSDYAQSGERARGIHSTNRQAVIGTCGTPPSRAAARPRPASDRASPSRHPSLAEPRPGGRSVEWVGGTFHARVPPLFSVTWAVLYRRSYLVIPEGCIIRNINGLLWIAYDFWL